MNSTEAITAIAKEYYTLYSDVPMNEVKFALFVRLQEQAVKAFINQEEIPQDAYYIVAVRAIGNYLLNDLEHMKRINCDGVKKLTEGDVSIEYGENAGYRTLQELKEYGAGELLKWRQMTW